MEFKQSSLVLILANLVPLIGVIWFDWRVLDIMILYWTESVIVGVINVLRMASCHSGSLRKGTLSATTGKGVVEQIDTQLPRRVDAGLKYFMIPFFIVHYGVFCLGHFMAVKTMFGRSGSAGTGSFSMEYFWQPEYLLAVAGIFISHLFSFFTNFIGKGENLRTNVSTIMQRPYGRILIMQVAIIGGAFLMEFLGSPVWMLLVLIVMKTLIDLRLHQAERRKLAAAQNV